MNNRKYTPIRRNANYEHKLGTTGDLIFIILVVIIFLKLYFMYGG